MRPISKSLGSWPGVIFSAPVPNSGSTCSSAMIGSRRPTSGSTQCLPTRSRVALVVGIDGDGGVGQHRLRAHGGDGQHLVGALDRVVDRVERVLDLAVLDLEVGDRRVRARVPVDHVVVAVDVALVEELLEDAVDGADVALVEGEALALVVAGGAEPLVLLDDPRAVLLLPLPDPLDEGLAAELVAVDALPRAALSRPPPGWRSRRGRCRGSRACCARASGSSAPARPASSRSGRGPCAGRRSRSAAGSRPRSSPPASPRPPGGSSRPRSIRRRSAPRPRPGRSGSSLQSLPIGRAHGGESKDG